MPEAYGIKETSEILKAAGDLAVVVYQAKKQATDDTGKLDASKLGASIAASIMANPAILDDLKAAADNISDVPKELKDLSLGEIMQLVSVSGSVAAKCATQIGA
jgi:hypothetical protein